MRTSIPVDQAKLEAALQQVEANGPLRTQNEVWIKTAEIYNASGPEKQITFSVVALRVKAWGIVVKTPVGRKGIASLSPEQKAKMQAGRSGGKRASRNNDSPEVRRHFATLERETPERFKKLLASVERGSKPAAIKLTCLACVSHVTSEVHKCTGYSCPLWTIRPYQGKHGAEEAEQDANGEVIVPGDDAIEENEETAA